jgi:tetratricopeptide (TPR) repeat protein
MRRDRRYVPSRLRLRRRLLVFSAPVVIVALLAAAKLISAVEAADSAGSHFAAGEVAALRTDVSTMRILNVIEPAKAPFAAGTLAVLEGRLDEADARFSEVISLADPALSCPARVNLELVRERQGDLDAWEGRRDQAGELYRSALAVVETAPGGCFAGNADPDDERRMIRSDAAARLTAKMANLAAAPPPPPPPPPALPPPPPPALAPASPAPDEPDVPLRLEPGAGDPIERLRQLLEDTAG